MTHNKRLRKEYSRPNNESDKLYRKTILHLQHDTRSCAEVCVSEDVKLEQREGRTAEEDDPAVHYGLIASGNSLMKDAGLRDLLS